MISEYRCLEHIVSRLMHNSRKIKEIGLDNGRMGVAIFFFELSRKTMDNSYEKFGMELLDSILEEIDYSTPVSYSNGLCDVGVGIIYLIKEGYVQVDSDLVFEEIDSRICSVIHFRELDNLSIRNGICGLGKYLTYRILHCETPECYLILKDKEHLIYLIDWIEEAMVVDKSYMADVLELMVDIRKTNIHKQKVEYIINCCSAYLFDGNWGLKGGMAGLGFSILNTNRLW